MNSIGAGEASCLQYLLDICQRRDRTAPFDALLTSWWAYQQAPEGSAALLDEWAANHRLTTNRTMLPSVHYISLAASSAFSCAQRTLVRDLIVPAPAIRQILFKQPPATIDDVRVLLKRLYWFALITNEEAEQLREAGLARRMPHGWDEGGNLVARYEAVGISIQDIGERVAFRATAGAGLKTSPTRPAGRATSRAQLFGTTAIRAVRP